MTEPEPTEKKPTTTPAVEVDLFGQPFPDAKPDAKDAEGHDQDKGLTLTAEEFLDMEAAFDRVVERERQEKGVETKDDAS